MPRNTALVVTTLVLGTVLSGCRHNEARAQDGDAASSATTSGRIRSVEVAGDRAAYVVDGNPGVRRPIVYLHGMCADPRDDLEAWGGIAKDHGTIVALVGDVPCKDRPGRTQWTTDPAALDERVEAAIRAVSTASGAKLEPGELLVIGESMGAARAELLASKFRDRYTRLVLVGSPQVPSPRNLSAVKAVANLAGEKETQEKMKAGTRALEGAGTPARFWELPGATHGQYGPEGERIMSEAVGFVAAR
jgi:pimeloyl-ACP methyl ester carboxylesterase